MMEYLRVLSVLIKKLYCNALLNLSLRALFDVL